MSSLAREEKEDVTSLKALKKTSVEAPRVRKSKRANMRLYPDDYAYLSYWSDQFGMDHTEFLIAAMYHYVKWKNHDYDLPTAETQRLNQMLDILQNLVATNGNLEKAVINGFDSMIGLMRGENYLLDDENGELP